MVGTWKQLPVGGGGFVLGLDMQADGQRLCRVDTYGAYIWSVSTSTWHQLVLQDQMPAADFGYGGPSGAWEVGGGCIEICAAPSNTAVIYMVWSARIYRSANRGTTFVRTSYPGTSWIEANGDFRMAGRRMAVDPTNPNHVIFGSDWDGIFRTTDGDTWTEISRSQIPITTGKAAWHADQSAGYMVAFDPTSGSTDGKTNRVLVYNYKDDGSGGLYVSDDCGVTWTKSNGGPTNCYRLVMAGNGTAWVRDHDGAVWRYVCSTQTWFQTEITGQQAIAVDPANNSRIVVIDGAGNFNFSITNGANGSWSGSQKYTRTTATDIPWLDMAKTNSGYFAPGDIMFDPSMNNELLAVNGIGVWRCNPPNFTGSWEMFSITKGIEQLCSLYVTAPNGYPVLGVQDRAIMRVPDVASYPLDQLPDMSAALTCTDTIDYAGQDKNFMVATVSPWVMAWVSLSRYCYSTDAGASWLPFNSWYAYITPSNMSASPRGGCLRITLTGGKTTTGLTTWANGSGTMMSSVNINGQWYISKYFQGSLYDRTCGPITVISDTVFDLDEANYDAGNASWLYTGTYLLFVDTAPRHNYAKSTPVTNVVDDGTGKIKVFITNCNSDWRRPFNLQGIQGVPEANGEWMQESATGTYVILKGSTFPVGKTYTTGGELLIPLGSGARVTCSSRNHIAIVPDLQNFPFVTTDGGVTWTEIITPRVGDKLPERKARVITNVVNDGTGKIKIIFSSFVGWQDATNNLVIQGVQGVEGVNGSYVWDDTWDTSDTYAVLKNSTWPGGTYTGGGEFLAYPPASDTGWGWGWPWYHFRRVTNISDRIQDDTMYLYNYTYGVYKVVNGVVTQQLQSNGSPWSDMWSGNQCLMDSVSSHSGHMFFCMGPQDVGAGHAHPTNGQGMYSRDGGANWRAVNGIYEPYGFHSGAIKPGNDYSTIYCGGWVDGVFGWYRSTSSNAQWSAGQESWEFLGDYPFGWGDLSTASGADQVHWDRMYVGFGGSGYAYYSEGSENAPTDPILHFRYRRVPA